MGASSHQLFGGVYRGRRVLVTGHTGFKGSWLSLWLTELGADVYGFSLPAPTEPSHWELLELPLHSRLGDIRRRSELWDFVASAKPEVIFHLAAQPLVRASYEQPLETYETNLLGSLNLYEAARRLGSVRAIVSVTTDKVYENREWVWGYREDEALGGHDPYSASKACADLASTSYARSFWPVEQYGLRHSTLLAIARAGNVVGGGDWALDRLVPDVVRGAASNTEAVIRRPLSTRPWQHVLEPLGGYLLLGQRLLEGETRMARAFNFGPVEAGVLTVSQVLEELAKRWDRVRYRVEHDPDAPHEAARLGLDCALARTLLRWRPVWDGEPCFRQTIDWYRAYYDRGEVPSREQLRRYFDDARALRLCWTGGEA